MEGLFPSFLHSLLFLYSFYSIILWIIPMRKDITDDQGLSVCRLSRFFQDHREGGLPD